MSGPGIVKIDTKVGSELIQSKGAVYLDVRTHEEHSAGQVPGAVHIPVAVNAGGQRVPNPDFLEQVKEAVPDTSTTLCVACMGGARAENAAEQLLAAGYQDVRQMCDGYRGWVNNQLPVQQRSKA